MRTLLLAAAAMAALIAPAANAAPVNVIPDNWTIITWSSGDGVLRDGSPWGPGSTPSFAGAPVDGDFMPEGTQWNNGSFWWDADPSVRTTPMLWTVQLNKSYNISRLLLQADDNDSYLIEYWSGGAWQSIFAVPVVGGFGLRTRDSGEFASIVTNRFRITATGGDNYFSFSEFQAFGAVPEPASWAMLIAGFGLVGAVSRRHRSAVSA